MGALSRHFYVMLFLLLSNIALAAETTKQTLPAVEKAFVAPDFTLAGEDGKTYRLADFRGKVVVINFWATWCPPCRFEMPSMERMWKKVRDKDVIVLAVNVGENADIIFEFLGQYPVTFPIPMDLDGSVIQKYPVTGLPTTYIVSPQGMVTHRAVGSREWDDPELYEQLLRMRKN